MKIGIVTWTSYYNYGTTLQNVALQYILKKYASEVRTISDKTIISENVATPPSLERLKRILKNVRVLMPQNITRRKQFKSEQHVLTGKYKSFYDNYICPDKRSLEEIYEDYDIVVCGSDQIWAPSEIFAPEYYSHYFLSRFKGKKVAYAPSIGSLAKNKTVLNIVTPWLNQFSAISCREASGAEFLSRHLNKNVQAVVDPTLLLNKDDWTSLLDIRKDTGESQYVLCYFLTYNKTYIKYAKQYASRKGLKLKIIVTDAQFISDKWECIYPSPQEFLSLIYNASKIFTDSFHGSIFSIHFNKDFTTFKRYADNTANNQNERVRNLFEWLGLTDRFIGEGEYDVNNDNGCDIDYLSVENKLCERRENSEKYLRDSIS